MQQESLSAYNPSKKRICQMSSEEAVQILAPMVAHLNLSTEKELQGYLDTLAANVPISDVWDKHRIAQHCRSRYKKSSGRKEVLEKKDYQLLDIYFQLK